MTAQEVLCRSCSAPITWVVTEKSAKSKGKRVLMPLDAEPVSDGNVELVAYVPEFGDPFVVAKVHAQTPMLPEGELFTSHFVTCPDSASWRKKK